MEQFLHANVPTRQLLYQEALFMSLLCRLGLVSIKEVKDYTHNMFDVLKNIYKKILIIIHIHTICTRVINRTTFNIFSKKLVYSNFQQSLQFEIIGDVCCKKVPGWLSAKGTFHGVHSFQWVPIGLEKTFKAWFQTKWMLAWKHFWTFYLLQTNGAFQKFVKILVFSIHCCWSFEFYSNTNRWVLKN